MVERGAIKAKVPGSNPGWSVIFSLIVIYVVWMPRLKFFSNYNSTTRLKASLFKYNIIIFIKKKIIFRLNLSILNSNLCYILIKKAWHKSKSSTQLFLLLIIVNCNNAGSDRHGTGSWLLKRFM